MHTQDTPTSTCPQGQPAYGQPAAGLQLAYNPGVSAREPWYGIRKASEHTCTVVTGYWPTAIDAADELLELAAATGEQVVIPSYLKDNLVVQWWTRGVNYYREQLPRELCSNSYERSGYDAAVEADSRNARYSRVSGWGWPQMAGAAD